MRHKAKKRPRWENLSLRQAYMDDNTCCELTPLLNEIGLKHSSRVVKPATDPHHIWHPPRVDIWSNLIALSRTAHDWCHQNKFDSTVLCMFVKHGKNELLPMNIRDLEGWSFNPVGYLDARQSTGAVEEIRVQLVSKLRGN